QKMVDIQAAEKELADAQKDRDQKAAEIQAEIKDKVVQRSRLEADAKATKDDLDSTVSLYDIAVEERDQESPGSARFKTLSARVEDVRKQVDGLRARLAETQDK